MFSFYDGLMQFSITTAPELCSFTDKYCKKLESFSHAPNNLKTIKRMSVFAENTAFLRLLDNYLQHYFDRHLQIVNEDGLHRSYEMIPFWYSIATLVQAEQEMASISNISNGMISTKHPHISILRRIFNSINNPVFLPTKDQVDIYFQELNKETAAYSWAKKIGLILPDSGDWNLYFTIQSIADSGDDAKRMTVRTKVFAPQGDGESYEISFFDKTKTISHSHSEKQPLTKIKLYNGHQHALSSAPDLINLKSFITELENCYGIKFSPEIQHSYFSKGIKKKTALQKWLIK